MIVIYVIGMVGCGYYIAINNSYMIDTLVCGSCGIVRLPRMYDLDRKSVV